MISIILSFGTARFILKAKKKFMPHSLIKLQWVTGWTVPVVTAIPARKWPKMNSFPRYQQSTSQFNRVSHHVTWVPKLRSLITLLIEIKGERARETWREKRGKDGGGGWKEGGMEGGREERKEEGGKEGWNQAFSLFKIYYMNNSQNFNFNFFQLSTLLWLHRSPATCFLVYNEFCPPYAFFVYINTSGKCFLNKFHKILYMCHVTSIVVMRLTR